MVEQERFNVLGDNYQRPFELATLRLQNMIDVLTHWQELIPENEDLLTQLGGGFVFNVSGDLVYEYKDTGILKYTDVKKALVSVDINLLAN